MLRRLTALMLVCTILSANFSRFFVYAGFEFNRNYIATVLCVNRDKPVMQCAGKCYLSKKLKQEAEKEKKQERLAKKTQLQEAFLTERTVLHFPPVIVQQKLSVELPFALPKHAATIFHPPQG
ncbi:hypothetical protein [Pedobacter immunditicola]|uniref:hypothetical protein n=1 Tax=Pedobacter immunditicola TaxID=3133440 RepID=UPI0030B08CA1